MQLSTEEELINVIEKMPDFEAYQSCLKELYNFDKSNLTQKEIEKLYFDKAILIPHIFATMESSTINSLTVFRARIISSSEDTSLINTFSYPNPSFCKSNGRANISNHPVFYCSDNPSTALLEIKPVIGTEIYLSTWKINCDREVQYSSFINPKVRETNVWFEHGQQIANFFIEKAKKLNTTKEKHLKLLMEFNSELFLKERENYPLTSWLANQQLYRLDGMDFIVYPSFATNNRTCNMAFHPNIIDKYFMFDRVFHLKFSGEFSFKVVNVGKVKRTHISWGELNEDDFRILPKVK